MPKREEEESVSVEVDLIGDAHDLSEQEAKADDDARGPAEDEDAMDHYGEDLDDDDDDEDEDDDDDDDDDDDW